MKKQQLEVLAKVGISVTKIEYEQVPSRGEMYTFDEGIVHRAEMEKRTIGEFIIDEERFGPMCYLIELVDKICESKNPMVNEQFNHLITLLELTKE